MSRLVVISNRLADPRKPAAGGGCGLGEALNQTGGLWFGWSNTVVEGGTPGEGELHTRQYAVTPATVDLCREDHDIATTTATATACCGRCSITGWTWPTSTPATSQATAA